MPDSSIWGCLSRVYTALGNAAGPDLHPDGDLGSQAVPGAGDEAHDDGAPGVDGGGSRGDGHQAGQRAIAHHADIVHMLACAVVSNHVIMMS
jgi:hypothetical protein